MEWDTWAQAPYRLNQPCLQNARTVCCEGTLKKYSYLTHDAGGNKNRITGQMGQSWLSTHPGTRVLLDKTFRKPLTHDVNNKETTPWWAAHLILYVILKFVAELFGNVMFSNRRACTHLGWTRHWFWQMFVIEYFLWLWFDTPTRSSLQAFQRLRELFPLLLDELRRNLLRSVYNNLRLTRFADLCCLLLQHGVTNKTIIERLEVAAASVAPLPAAWHPQSAATWAWRLQSTGADRICNDEWTAYLTNY